MCIRIVGGPLSAPLGRPPLSAAGFRPLGDISPSPSRRCCASPLCLRVSVRDIPNVRRASRGSIRFLTEPQSHGESQFIDTFGVSPVRRGCLNRTPGRGFSAPPLRSMKNRNQARRSDGDLDFTDFRDAHTLRARVRTPNFRDAAVERGATSELSFRQKKRGMVETMPPENSAIELDQSMIPAVRHTVPEPLRL